MKIFYCLAFVFLLGSSYVAAQHHIKRASGPNQNASNLAKSMSGLLSVVIGFPVVGPMVSDMLNGISNFITDLEIITNGALGRLLGGVVPCTLSVPGGFVCQGLNTVNGGVGKFFMDIVNNVPSMILPSIFKKMIGLFINAVIDPTLDLAFGGITVA